MPAVYQAAWLFPVNQPPLRRGYLTVENGRVVELSVSAPSSGEVLDLGDIAILPRPINAHTHLEFSDLEAPLGAPRQPFAQWIADVLATRASRTAPKSNAISRGQAELAASLACGVGEIASPPVSLEDYAAPDPAAPLSGVIFHELISTDYDRGAERLAEIASLADRWPANSPFQFGLSPHAPYTLDWKLFNKSIDLAIERNWPVAMHLAESFDEMELLASHSGRLHQLLIDRGVWNPASLPRGVRPADYLARLAEAPRALAIHGNFFTRDEYEILARHRDRLTLVICPRTCRYFLPELPPIAELLAQGVAIALGTDSRATNPDLSIWREARFLLENAPALAPTDLLSLVTLAGADALGLPPSYGRIPPGAPLSLLAAAPVPSDAADPNAALAAIFSADLLPLAF